MGNAALRDIGELDEVSEADVEGSTVAVDAFNWLYKYLTPTVEFTDDAAYTTADGTEIPTLIGAVQGLPRFFENDITPIFVFDGDSHSAKEQELAERRDTREAAAEKADDARSRGDTIEAARQDARSARLTETMVETTMEFFDLMDVPYMTAPQAGESQAAHIVKNGDAEYVISDDYDALLFGATATVRNFTSSSRPLERLSFPKTLKTHDISHEQLVDVALLCGTDYNGGVRGFGPATALKKIREYGDLETLLDEEDKCMENVAALQSLFLEPNVTDEYEVSSTCEPDITAAESFVVDEWEIAESEVSTSFEKLSDAFTQTGLDRWS